MTKLMLRPDLPLTVLQLIVVLQFTFSFTIFVSATVGVSVGYQVASYFLLSALQAIAAVPGMAYVVTRNSAVLSIYILFQMITGVSEFYWLLYMITQGEPFSRYSVLLLLTVIQVTGVVSALFFRDKMVKFGAKPSDNSCNSNKSITSTKSVIEDGVKRSKSKPKLKNASASMNTSAESPSSPKSPNSRSRKSGRAILPKKSNSNSSSLYRSREEFARERELSNRENA